MRERGTNARRRSSGWRARRFGLSPADGTAARSAEDPPPLAHPPRPLPHAAGWRAQFVSGLIWSGIGFVGNLGYVFLAWAGALQVLSGRLSVGDVQAFLQYARQLIQPVTQLANASSILQSTIAAAERVFRLLDESEEDDGSAPPLDVLRQMRADLPQGEPCFLEGASPSDVLRKMQGHPKSDCMRLPVEGWETWRARGNVRFEDVWFAYRTGEPVLRGISFSVPAGTRLAIVGPTGSGKTTLVSLLLRFYERGRILLDGKEIREISRGVLRRQFGYVPQDAWLFPGTLRENLLYGREEAQEEEIWEVLRAVRLAESSGPFPAASIRWWGRTRTSFPKGSASS